jgi:parvulin-like peptidyl-prolyl isomerase
MMKTMMRVWLLGTLVGLSLAAAAQDGKTTLGGYQDIEVTDQDLLTEVEIVRSTRDIEVQPDRNGVFTMVENMLLRRILAREAEQEQLIPDDEMQARLRRQRNLWLSQARLDQLGGQLTDEQLEAAAREIYLAHKEDYRSEERVDTSHILIRTGSKWREEDAAKVLADELYAQLVADPARFEALAAEFSEDPKSAKQGGKVGWMETKRLVKPYREAALALQPGQISTPVKTQFGFHIIRLNDHSPAAQLPFEKVRPGLMRQAEQQARKVAIETHLGKLKRSSAYRYDEAAVQKLFETHFADQAPAGAASN